MAGLLLELRRQLARNRRQTTYHKPHVYTLEPQNERHVTETVKETTKENKLSEEIPEETQAGSIHERNVGVVSKEDFLLSQIDEFRERAKQLQSLLDTKETQAQAVSGGRASGESRCFGSDSSGTSGEGGQPYE